MNNIFAKLVDKFTLKYLPLKDLVEYAKTSLNNTNSGVKAAASNLSKALYK